MSFIGELTGSGQRRRTRTAELRGLADVQGGYEGAQGYLDPYASAGTDALSRVLAGLAPGGEFRFDPSQVDVTQDPGYQFRLDQGNQAIERSAAARGTELSGQTLRGLVGYSQGLASQEYGNAYNRALQSNELGYSRTSDILNRGYGAANVLAELRNGLGTNLANIRTRSAAAQNSASQAFNNLLIGGVSGAGAAYLGRPPQ